jgi:hypothetical protein
MANIHVFDDDDNLEAIATASPIACGDPQSATHAVTLGSSASAVSNIDNPTELNLKKGRTGQVVLVVKVAGATAVDDFTFYAYDDSGPAVNPPYVIEALRQDPLDPPANERWIAIGGKYSYITQMFKSAIFKSLYIQDTNQSNELHLKWNEDDAADRILNLLLNGASRSINLTGNLTIESDSVLNQDLTTDANPTFNTLLIQGTKVLDAQQSAEADAAAVSAIALSAGADTVDLAAFNTALTTLVTEINALKTKLNNALAKLRTHGLIAT